MESAPLSAARNSAAEGSDDKVKELEADESKTPPRLNMHWESLRFVHCPDVVYKYVLFQSLKEVSRVYLASQGLPTH